MLNYKRFVAVVAILSLVTTNFISVAQAASLANAKDTLSNSDIGGTGTHVVTFTTGVALNNTDKIEITLPNPATVGAITCPTNFASSTPGGGVAVCTASTTINPGTYTVTIPGIVNPATSGPKPVIVSTKTAGGTVIETASLLIAIIDNVDVSATVPSTLTFTIAGVVSGTAVNKATTTVTSSSTALAFGNLEVGTSSIMAQELTVTTNASAGYTVTVQQNQKLTSSGGSSIATFRNDTASTEAWAAPAGTLDATSTYGFFGLTSNDWSLAAGADTFKATSTAPAAFYTGLNGTAPVAVMYNGGVADGLTPAIGKTQVAYRLEVSALQPAGDYSNILTYVATPTY